MYARGDIYFFIMFNSPPPTILAFLTLAEAGVLESKALQQLLAYKIQILSFLT